MLNPNKIKTLPLPAQILLLATLYFVGGHAGALLALPPGYVSPMWPPSGIAIAAMLFWGKRCWLGVLLGSFAYNLSISPNWSLYPHAPIALFIALGSTFQTLFSRWLIESFTTAPWRLDTPLQILTISLLGGLAGCIIAPVIGNLTLFGFGLITSGQLPLSLFTWWVGDAMGVIVFTPALLLLLEDSEDVKNARKRWVAIPYISLFGLIMCLFFITQSYEKNKIQTELELESTELNARLQDRMNIYLSTLAAIGQFYKASTFVDPEEFKIFTESFLSEQLATEAIMWVPVVTEQNITSFLKEARSKISENIFIDLIPNSSTDTSNTENTVRFPILYIQPQQKFTKLLGADFSTHDIANTLLKSAHDSKSPRASAEPLIQSSTSQHRKIYLILPFDNQNLKYSESSILIGVYDLDAIINEILKALPIENLSFTITDQHSDLRLFTQFSDGNKKNNSYVPDASHVYVSRNLYIASSSWEARYYLTDNFITQHSTWSVWMVLSGGLFITSLIGNLLMLTTGSTAATERLIASRTQELKALNKTIKLEKRELIERQAFLDSLIDNLPLMLFVKEANDLKFVRLNKVGESLLGVSEKEMLGKNDYDFFPAEQANHFVKTDRKVLNGNTISDIPQEPISTPSGERILHTRKIPIKDADGFPRYLLGVSEDITEKLNAENRFLSLFNTTPNGLAVINQKGEIVLANTIFGEVFGYDSKEITKLNLSNLLPKPTQSRHHSFVEDFFRFPKRRSMGAGRELTGITKNGVEIPLEIALNPIIFNDQPHVFTAISDTSERNQLISALQIQEETNRSLLNAAGEGIYGLNTKGEATFVNPAAAEMLGYEVKELIGAHMHARIHHSYPDGSQYPKDRCPMYAAITDGNEYTITDEVLWRKDGSSLPVVYTSTPLQDKDGKICGAVVIFRDTTLLQEHEQALIEKTRELERVNRYKTEFLANMSHELRTPLNSIIGFTEILLKRSAEKLEIRELDALKTVKRNGKHLLTLIDNILDLSKIEAGRMEVDLEKIRLDELLPQELNQYHNSAESKGIQLELHMEKPNIELISDRTKVKQILGNICSNALKYTDSGSVDVSAKSDDHFVYIEIKDTGIGISDADQKKLFSEFARTKEVRQRNIQGTGLGLAITAKLVELLCGEINFTSEHKKGSTFTVKLPLDFETEVNKITAKHNLIDGNPTILCLDENKDSLQHLKLLLADAGYGVLIAERAHNIVKLIGNHRVDLICLDLLLSSPSGIDLIQQLRQTPSLSHIPVIVLSNIRDHEAHALSAGANLFRTKPVANEALLNDIRRLLNSQKAVT